PPPTHVYTLSLHDALPISLDRLQFPHETFRGGQRQLAESVYKSVSTGRCLLVEAPTGIGKTLATLFPVLKAFSLQRLDRVFFLVDRKSTRLNSSHVKISYA